MASDLLTLVTQSKQATRMKENQTSTALILHRTTPFAASSLQFARAADGSSKSKKRRKANEEGANASKGQCQEACHKAASLVPHDRCNFAAIMMSA